MVPKPSEECLGQWIVDDMRELRQFASDMVSDYWQVGIAEYREAWQSTGDLLFDTFDACHFKMVMEDVASFCQLPEDGDDTTGRCSSSKIMAQMQKNVFGLVT